METDVENQIGEIEQMPLAELKAEGIKPKTTKQNGGKTDFSRGQLAHLLKNPVYIGKARHKDKVYEGEHEAILPKDLFDQVQAKLKAQAPFEIIKYREKDPFLLRGLLFDDEGRPFTTSHSNKKGKRYHYYMTRPMDGQKISKTCRMPVKKVDDLVIQSIQSLFKNSEKLKEFLSIAEPTTEDWARIGAAAHLTKNDIRVDIIHTSLTRAELATDRLSLTLDIPLFTKALRIKTASAVRGKKQYNAPILIQLSKGRTILSIPG